jgi:hypothetical protein
MTMLNWMEVSAALLGFLALFAGNRLSMPVLQNGGLALCGAAFLVGGVEAILTRRIAIVLSRRRNENYRGLGAILYGIIFLIMGAAMVVLAMILHLDAGQTIFHKLVERPGFGLLAVGTLFLLWAGVALIGSMESRQGPGWEVALNLLVSRMLPGLILVVLGLAILGIGLLEIVAPAGFDEMGGGFLEVLFLGSP